MFDGFRAPDKWIENIVAWCDEWEKFRTDNQKFRVSTYQWRNYERLNVQRLQFTFSHEFLALHLTFQIREAVSTEIYWS